MASLEHFEGAVAKQGTHSIKISFHKHAENGILALSNLRTDTPLIEAVEDAVRAGAYINDVVVEDSDRPNSHLGFVFLRRWDKRGMLSSLYEYHADGTLNALSYDGPDGEYFTTFTSENNTLHFKTQEDLMVYLQDRPNSKTSLTDTLILSPDTEWSYER